MIKSVIDGRLHLLQQFLSLLKHHLHYNWVLYYELLPFVVIPSVLVDWCSLMCYSTSFYYVSYANSLDFKENTLYLELVFCALRLTQVYWISLYGIIEITYFNKLHKLYFCYLFIVYWNFWLNYSRCLSKC